MSGENRISQSDITKTRHGAGRTGGFIAKMIFGVVYNLIFFGAMLFLPAGTFDWPRAWVFLGLVLVGTTATMVLVFPGREDLLDERFKPPVQKGQPLADKIITLMLIAGFLGVIVFIPLDVFRFHMMSKPGALVSSLGLMFVIAGWWIISLVFKENAFAAPVVKHQEERHQTVIDTGVYSIVRHPMYAGAILLMVGLPLWLESYAAALLALAPIATIVTRILFEERFLKGELKGYEAYTKRVRYRLIPFIW
ncbi:MAG TPA: isoprenylcysteine carboxylmethyltransferase family protein [Blastocatellia bacterium]|nr:isoprenylcysteine carboxylmethyltransferase family protein [Blastocatellia bacterium]